MLDEIFLRMIIKDELCMPYINGDKTLSQAIDDFYKTYFSKEYPEELDNFARARDLFDTKISILQFLIQLKKFNEKKEDYKVLIEYFKKAVAEFEEALKEE